MPSDAEPVDEQDRRRHAVVFSPIDFHHAEVEIERGSGPLGHPQARSEGAAKASPGGSMSAFCGR
jgi:hypothetical protein